MLRLSRSPLLLLACSGTGGPATPPVDAATWSDAGAGEPDAGPTRDPAAVRWEMIEPPSDGPLGVWGFVVAPLGDGRAVLFGGTTSSDAGGDTLGEAWLYDMRGATPTATRLAARGPSPRYCACAAYDPDREVVVLVGGRNLDAPLSIPPETWELDLAAERWSQAPVPETPGAVVGCALAYSRAARAMILFGGAGATGHPDTTWRYDTAAPGWNALDAVGPSGRYDPSFTPLSDGRRLLLFAGSVGARGAAFFSDVWLFDAVDGRWTELHVEGPTPRGRRTPWTVLEAGDRGLYVAHGFDGAMAPIGDFWHLDLEAARWRELPVEAAPPARGFSQALPGPAGALGTMLGGYDGVRPVRDVWVLRAD